MPSAPHEPDGLPDLSNPRRIARAILGDEHDVDDVVQETWLAVLSTTPRRAVRHPLAHLGGIARNLARNAARRRGERRRFERRAARRDRDDSDPALLAEQRCHDKLLLSWVVDLDEPYRTAILLRFVSELRAAEIARRQGIPASTVRVRVRRGLQMLRARYEREYDERDRRSLLAALGLLGTPRPLRTVTAVGTVLAAVLVGVMLVAGGNSLPRRDHVDRLDSVDVSVVSPRRRARDAAGQRRAGDAVARAPRLSGRLTLTLDGRLLDAPLDIAAERWGPCWLPARLMPPKPAADVPMSPVARVTVASGRDFAVAVPERGRYRLRVTSPAARGAFYFWPSTEAPLHSGLALLPGVDVVTDRPGPVLVGAWDGTVHAVTTRRTGPAGRLHLSGPLFPGVRVGLVAADGPPWWTEVFHLRANLKRPQLGEPRVCAVVDGDTYEHVEGARLEVYWLGRDVRPWLRELVTDADGEAHWARPLERSPLGGRVVIRAPGHAPRRLSLKRGADLPDDIELVREHRGSWSISAAAPRPMDGGIVVGSRGRRADWWAPVASGRFTPHGDAVGTTAALVLTPDGAALRADVSGRSIEVGPAVELLAEVHAAAPIDDATIEVLPVAHVPLFDLGAVASVAAEPGAVVRVGAFAGGPWLVVARASGCVPRVVEWTAGTPLPLRLDLDEDPAGEHAAASLALRVSDETGFPLLHAPCLLARGDRPHRVVTTDAEGRAVFEGVPRGEPCRVHVLASGHRLSLATPAELWPREQPHDVVMKRLVTVATALPHRLHDGGRRVFIVADVADVPGGRADAVEVDAGRGLVDLAAERQRVTLYAPGCRAVTTTVDPTRPDSCRIELDPDCGAILELTGAVGERVRIAALEVGDTAAHRHALAALMPSFSSEVTVTGRGPVRTPPLTPGRYRLEARSGGEILAVVEVDVDEGRAIELGP